MIYIGEKIRELRIAKRMTQRQLADKLDLTKGAISAYEQGAKYPSLEVLVKMCQVFQVSADYLLGLSDNIYCKDMLLTEEQEKLIRGIIREFENVNAKYD